MNTIRNITGIVLAGGLSRRMGRDKREIILNRVTLLDQTITLLNEIFPDVLVVFGEDNSLEKKGQFCSVQDIHPNCGSIGGLFTGLYYSKTSHVFVVGCDMPFLSKQVIRWMCKTGMAFDVFIPKVKEKIHPLHGLYSRACLPFFEKMVLENNLKIQEILNNPDLKIGIVDENDMKKLDQNFHSLMNLNTPNDLKKAMKITDLLKKLNEGQSLG